MKAGSNYMKKKEIKTEYSLTDDLTREIVKSVIESIENKSGKIGKVHHTMF